MAAYGLWLIALCDARLLTCHPLGLRRLTGSSVADPVAAKAGFLVDYDRVRALELSAEQRLRSRTQEELPEAATPGGAPAGAPARALVPGCGAQCARHTPK